MPTVNLLSPELKRAAAALELRLRLLGAPTTKEPMEKWEALSEHARAAVPPWLPELSSRYALNRVQLLFPHPTASDEPPTFLTFLSPEAYETGYAEGMFELPAMGFHVFATESNRDTWVTTAEAGPSGDVYLFEPTNWGGSHATPENGLKHAHTSLAAMLSIAAIGAVEESEWITYAIWFQRREEVEEIESRARMSAQRAEDAQRRRESTLAVAAWQQCAALLDEIAAKYPLLFDRKPRVLRTTATTAIRRLGGNAD